MTFVDDVSAFESMKLRLLNGSHTALSYIAALAFAADGDRTVTVDAAMADPDVARFVRRYMEEIAPTLQGGPEGEQELHRYCDSLMERFSNPDISDRVSRLCQDGSKKMQGFVVPPLRELLQAGQEAGMVQQVVASWYVYLSEWGEEVDDPAGVALVKLAQGRELEAFLRVGVGEFVTEKFCKGVEREVVRLREGGARDFLKESR